MPVPKTGGGVILTHAETEPKARWKRGVLCTQVDSTGESSPRSKSPKAMSMGLVGFKRAFGNPAPTYTSLMHLKYAG